MLFQRDRGQGRGQEHGCRPPSSRSPRRSIRGTSLPPARQRFRVAEAESAAAAPGTGGDMVGRGGRCGVGGGTGTTGWRWVLTVPSPRLQRFRFCGDLDCPDWVLAEISTLAKIVKCPSVSPHHVPPRPRQGAHPSSLPPPRSLR